MNRRAEWPIIGLGAINSASRQVVLRDSGNRSIGRRQVFVLASAIHFTGAFLQLFEVVENCSADELTFSSGESRGLGHAT